MISLSEISARIADQVPGLRHVGTARDFGSARENTIAWPSAFVVPLQELSGKPRYQAHLLDQRVVLQFGVVFAVRDLRDRTGEQALTEAETIRAEVLSALGSYVPQNAQTSCEPASGRLLGGIGKNGQMFWQDNFNVAFDRRIQIEEA